MGRENEKKPTLLSLCCPCPVQEHERSEAHWKLLHDAKEEVRCRCLRILCPPRSFPLPPTHIICLRCPEHVRAAAITAPLMHASAPLFT
jgi:hypothetical protein